MTAASRSLIEALHTDRPAPNRAEKMGLYGWLVGGWEMDAVYHPVEGSTRRSRGEIHFGWVLAGRAIQDVWIVPPRDQQPAEAPAWGDFYGTTLRVYDPGLDAWHILWIDPVKQFYTRQIGRARGSDIVQEGKDDTGAMVRWSFTDITPDSFHWLGERSQDGGASWRLEVEFFAHRIAAQQPTSICRPSESPMIDHVSIGVRDPAKAKRFYDAALKPLGYECLSQDGGSLGYGREAVALWIGATKQPVPPGDKSNLHFCFAAPTREAVDAFHAKALQAGGRDNGRPGLRPDYGAGYYAAFVVDPDGYRLEAHCGSAGS
jgi:catechol 2,3-dioxygenase-like lactoylglutathione lyase family enzyme